MCRKNDTINLTLNSQGGVVWVPKDCTYGYKMNWAKFAKLMVEHGSEGHK